MNLIMNNEVNPILKTSIQGSEITIRFADKPNPHVKDNIIEILTSCYEGRVQTVLNKKHSL